METNLGLEFRNDELCVFRTMGKIKLQYSQIKKVVFFPALIGKRAWTQIKTAERSYVLAVPNFKEVLREFSDLNIVVKTNKVFLSILVAVMAFLILVGRGRLFGLVCLVLMLLGFISKNGYWSRLSEIFLFLAGIGLGMVVVSVSPLSKEDIKISTVMTSLARGQYDQVSKICLGLQMSENEMILNDCAWFFVTAKDSQWRNYKLGMELATQALENTTNQKHLAANADTLGCAYIGLGRQDYALQVANDYSLSSRIRSFGNNELCLP
jgi:hypothetical protein